MVLIKHFKNCFLILLLSHCQTPKAVEQKVETAVDPNETASESSVNSSSVAQSQDSDKDVLPISMWSPAQRQASSMYLYLVGEMQLLRGEPKQASSNIEAAYGLDPNSFLAEKYLLTHSFADDPNGFTTEARRMTLLYPKNAQLFLIYGTILAATEHHKEAIEAVQRAIQLNGKQESYYFQLVLIYQKNKDTKNALKTAKRMAQLFPQSPSAWVLLSRLYLVSGMKKEALEPAQRAYEIQGLNPEIALIYALVSDLNGLSQNAIRAYEQLYRLNPTNEELIGRMVELYHSFGNLEAALSLIEDTLAQTQTKSPFLAIQRYIVLIELKKFDLASQAVQEMMVQFPDSDRVLYLGGLNAERDKKFDEALQIYTKILEDSAMRKHANFRSSAIYREQKKYDESEKFARKLIDAADSDPDGYVMLAGIYADQEKLSRAVDILQKGYEKFPEQSRLLFLIGVYQERNGSFNDAVKTMKRVIEADPQNSTALNFVGYMYAEKGENLDEAEKLIATALKIKPDDGLYLDSLGWVYYQRKQYAKAEGYIVKALQKFPEEGVIAEHLGDIKKAQGFGPESQELYKKALEKVTDERDIKRIKSKINFKE